MRKLLENVRSGLISFSRCKSSKPLSLEYFDKCEELAYNSIKTFDRVFLINLKKGPDSVHFFKLSEKSFGRRTNMYFGAQSDTDNFLECLKGAPEAKDEQVFASTQSETFPERSITMQRVLNHYILIVEEDLSSDKARKIHLDIELVPKIARIFQLQLNLLRSSPQGGNQSNKGQRRK